MMKNILIGSCGGLTGSYLARYYKTLHYHVLGFDSSSINQTKFFLDEFYILPKSNESLFIDKLINLLNEKRIDYYIPTHSSEVRVVSKYETKITVNTNAKFLVSPYETYLLLDNKEIANVELSKVNIPVPKKFSTSLMPDSFPIIMKKNFGSGSNGIFEINSLSIFTALKNNNEYSFFKKIIGNEYTVDCIFNDKYELIAYNQRKRNKNMGGAVIITQNDYSFDISPYIKIIATNFKFKGCVNFQYIISDNTPYFIDINLRFPSGGLPLTIASGIDIPKLYIDIMDKKNIGSIKSNQCENKIMYRYFNEIFEG